MKPLWGRKGGKSGTRLQQLYRVYYTHTLSYCTVDMHSCTHYTLNISKYIGFPVDHKKIVICSVRISYIETIFTYSRKILFFPDFRKIYQLPTNIYLPVSHLNNLNKYFSQHVAAVSLWFKTVLDRYNVPEGCTIYNIQVLRGCKSCIFPMLQGYKSAYYPCYTAAKLHIPPVISLQGQVFFTLPGCKAAYSPCYKASRLHIPHVSKLQGCISPCYEARGCVFVM
jgi:hypothetical protein